jgi:hypothetical protein
MRVPAARLDAVERSGREPAPLVHLMAQRANDGRAGEVLLRWGVAHTLQHAP